MNRSSTTARETTKIGAKPVFQVAVRTLVAFVLRCGDLRTDYMGAASAVEGIRAHQRIQRRRPAGYEAEVPVRHRVTRPGFDLCVSGRIDGVLRQSDPPVVEEIKTTRRPLDEVAAAPSPVHWGQALCYAYLWGLQEGVAALDVRLTYVHADSGRDCELVRHLSMEALTNFFDDLIGRYLPWIERLAQWLDTRDRSVARLAFPYAAYRPGQREMAVAVFRAIRDGGHLMVQAATGIGKTMAALYPAIKALGERHTAKVAFLTARTTGRLAAQDALQTLAQAGLRLKWVVLTAKEKICFSPGLGCDPETCPFAKGHFDRLNDALAAALSRDALTREAIEQVSREHQVCPFELSLELLDWSDGMVGDYNYAFDPHVTLRRLFGDEGVRPAVLVDEAHNLVDRARDMFSAQLDKTAVLDLRRELKQGAPMLYRALGPVNAWMNERRGDCRTAGGTCIDPDAPAPLVERLQVFMAAADRWLRRNVHAPFRDALLGFFFECHRFVRIAEQYSAAYTTISQAAGKAFRIKLFCMDPSG
ncbi:MAG: DEAD/DEAH box helicase, partial [Desulfatitalea sp.]|nr:DEAD/DEAH box helicase [Desulfatitalea sp.]